MTWASPECGRQPGHLAVWGHVWLRSICRPQILGKPSKKKNFTSWKGYFWPNKSDVFSSNLGRGGAFVTLFFKASLTLANNFDSSLRWDHWWWYQRWCDTVLCTVIIIILPWKCWLIISECCLHRISSLATVIIYDWIFVLNELDNSPNRVVLVIRLLRHVLCTLDFWKVY